ncbi:MAG: DUF5666 domain-containing protein [Chloroflexota bacterium]
MTCRLFRTAALLLLLIPALILAQTQPTPAVSISFFGTIESRIGTALVINGQVIDLSAAVVTTPVEPGTIVYVEGSIEPDGSITASSVSAQPHGILPGIIEIEGVITALSGSSVSLASQSFDLTPDTRIIGTLSIGQPVRVYAVALAHNRWAARLVATLDEVPAPAATPELVPPPVTTPEVLPSAVTPPVATPEVVPAGSGSDVQPPAVTPEPVYIDGDDTVPPPVATPEVSYGDDDGGDDHHGGDDHTPVSTPEVRYDGGSEDEDHAPVSTPEVVAPASTPEVAYDDNFRIEGTLDAVGSIAVMVDGQRYFLGDARIDDILHVGDVVRLEVRVVDGQWVLDEIKVIRESPQGGSGSGSSGSGGSGSGGSGSSGSGSGGGSGSSGSGSGGSGSGGSGGSGSGGSGSGGSGSGGSGSGGGGDDD